MRVHTYFLLKGEQNHEEDDEFITNDDMCAVSGSL